MHIYRFFLFFSSTSYNCKTIEGTKVLPGTCTAMLQVASVFCSITYAKQNHFLPCCSNSSAYPSNSFVLNLILCAAFNVASASTVPGKSLK